VLRLVGHSDPTVQKQALLASQKVLLSRDKADFLANLVRLVPPLCAFVAISAFLSWLLSKLHAGRALCIE